MSTQELSILFLQLSLLFAGILICTQITNWFKQPAIVGELMAGILLGSAVLGFFAPNFYQKIFLQSQNVIIARDSFLLIGLLLFLFSTGMEVNLKLIRGRIRQIFLIGGFGILIPFLLGMASVFLFPNLWHYSFDLQGWILPLFIGTALSISALPIIARILLDLNLLDKEAGTLILTSAVLDDIIGWSFFAVCLNLLRSNGVSANVSQIVGSVLSTLVIIFIAAYFIARPLLTWLNAKKYSGAFATIAVMFVFGSAALSEGFGIHPVFGAFLVGVVFTQFNLSEANKQSQRMLHQIAIYVFAPLYFASVGLKVNFIAQFDFLLTLFVTVIANVGKVVGAGLGAKLSGFDSRTSLVIGYGLNARGAIGIILASVAWQNQMIDERIFVALVLMSLITSLVSGVMLKRVMTKV
jgi:Kef-type K+ transport system membrane component KefB